MNLRTFILFVSCSIITTVNGFAKCIPQNLKTEYLVNPLGIDAKAPRLSWQINDDRNGAKQTAYQLFLGSDSLKLSKGIQTQWTSGKIPSSEMLVQYQGIPLNPFTKYFWTVKVWDMNGKESTSAIASFEMGMMNVGNWKGKWITDVEDIELRPAPYFRKEFSTSKKIKSARAYIVAAGLFELYVNGKKVGNHRLDPAFTRFDRRVLYVTHDVTGMIQNNRNAVGVILGNGWYNHQPNTVWEFNKAAWRARPKFCMDLRLVYEDGSTEVISTGTDWKTSLGPILFNSIYVGEHYDARLEQKGWDKINFKDSEWKNVVYTNAPTKNIVAQTMHPIRNVEKIAFKEVTKINPSTYIFDLERNISGVCSIRAKGNAGDTIRLMHAERLDEKGRADQSNIDAYYKSTNDPFQTDIFILSGRGEETFMPRFNYKGFQFVEVTCSNPIELTAESLTAHFMHSDVPPTGSIHSSNSIFNKILRATNNSYLCNLFGYPTDCPQREKNGWTGDAHIAIETGLYNFDAITVYEKWMADHRDEQQPNGLLPDIIPTAGWGYGPKNLYDWTSSIAIIPWTTYIFYGDPHLLELCYENIKKYVDDFDENNPAGLSASGRGDWLPVRSFGSVELTTSIYCFVDASILSKAAKILGKEKDYEKYAALSDKIRKAINAKYLDDATGIYSSGLQTELSFPLFWEVTPENQRTKVVQSLVSKVHEDKDHIDVGLLGSKSILNVLSENGYADLAYKVASQEEYPGWGHWILNGATTLSEGWAVDPKAKITSLNHIMFGEISAWSYKALGGIHPDPKNPGFKNIILKPHFVEGLQSFTASHEGPYGLIESSWKKSEKKISYTVHIPANSSATLNLEGKNIKISPIISGNKNDSGESVFQLPAGKYLITLEQ